MPDGWVAKALDEVEAVAWRGTELTWRPLRGALGTRIAGMGAYTAARAGQEVVEPHAESRDGRGHEEVYVVLRGRATFWLDGDELDAPAGTFVCVRDPRVHRRAVAVEAGTAVLAIGGDPRFEPAASEWIERARPWMRDDPARARAILDELRAERPESPGLALGEALLAAAQGDRETAARRLAEVLAREPRLREVVAREEPTLAGLLPAG